jgi:phospholipid-translocating ATPase
MSVIVRNDENKILLLCKGADRSQLLTFFYDVVKCKLCIVISNPVFPCSVMFERLSQHGREFEAETNDHIKRYSEAGLRTLVITYRELGEEEYNRWDKEFSKAKTSLAADRDTLVDAAADKMERDLILLGATAVEDRLQKGVSITFFEYFYLGMMKNTKLTLLIVCFNS